MEVKEFLEKIGISRNPNQSGSRTYVVDIDDSDEFGKFYSLLEKSNLVELDDESSQITSDTMNVQFESDDFIITMLGDMVADKYKMTIKTLK